MCVRPGIEIMADQAQNRAAHRSTNAPNAIAASHLTIFFRGCGLIVPFYGKSLKAVMLL